MTQDPRITAEQVGSPPPAAAPETEAEFQARLHQMVADGTAAEEGRKALARWSARQAGAAPRGPGITGDPKTAADHQACVTEISAPVSDSGRVSMHTTLPEPEPDPEPEPEPGS